MQRDPDWLTPDWGLADVGAFMTTRAGGGSTAPYDAMNLGVAVGDDPAQVARNRRRVADVLGATPVYMKQVHGRAVLRLTAADAQPRAPLHEADASVTTEPGIACAVQAADCLPVLFATEDGRAVGAAHAGWRGLALGVLEATLAAVCEAGACEPGQVRAWLGACIGPESFEVGPEVLRAFGASSDTPRFAAHVPGKWMADLAGLARDRLAGFGVGRIDGGHWCTVSEPSRFFSYRRDRVTGRMAAFVWIEPRSDGR